MLEGLKRQTSEVVKLWQLDDESIRQVMHEIQADRDLVTCFVPACGCSMHVRALDSEKVTAHFARYPGSGNSNHPAEGESEEHLRAKAKLAMWLQRRYPGADITTEKTLEIPDGYRTTRRADVFVTLANGETEAHEVQFSPQNTAKTERRTSDYKQASVNRVVWWWTGKALDNRAVAEWCISNCEFYGTIVTPRQSIMGKLIPGEPKFDIYDCASIRDKRRKEAEELERRRASYFAEKEDRETRAAYRQGQLAAQRQWKAQKDTERQEEEAAIAERKRQQVMYKEQDEQPAASPTRTVTFPADAKLAFPAGTWQRLDDGRIQARLDLAGMRQVAAWARMLSGDDSVSDGELLGQ